MTLKGLLVGTLVIRSNFDGFLEASIPEVTEYTQRTDLDLRMFGEAEYADENVVRAGHLSAESARILNTAKVVGDVRQVEALNIVTNVLTATAIVASQRSPIYSIGGPSYVYIVGRCGVTRISSGESSRCARGGPILRLKRLFRR